MSAGNPVYLYLTFYGGQDVKEPKVPPVEGLQIRYVGPSTKISVINGRASRLITHTYLLISLKSGEYNIGPFFAEYHGQMYKADAVTLTVNGAPAVSSRQGSVVTVPSARDVPQADPYVSDRIFLVMEVDRRKVYINEIVPVTIKVYVNRMALRDIEYPSFSHEGFSAEEFAEPERRQEILRGIRYDMLIFRQNLFGIKEGDYILGPAKLQCKMVVRKESSRRSSIFGASVFDDDFFSSRFGYRAYPIEVESDEIPVSILAFPEEGRPEDFQGAVGDFSMNVRVDPAEVKVGDPIALRTVISGKGNLDTVTAPRLAASDKFKMYEPQVTIKGGRKIYERILIPKSVEAKDIPEISFSFFNPRSGKYESIRKGPLAVKVAKRPESERAVKMVSLPGVEQMFYPGEELGKDIIHIKEKIGKLRLKDRFLYENPFFWLGQIVPLTLFIGLFGFYRKKERIRSDKGYARYLRAPRKARSGLAKAGACLAKEKVALFYDAVFRTLQEYLGDRFNLPKGNVTGQVVEQRLSQTRCDEKILEMLRDIFSKCEMARYASSVPGRHEAEETLEKVRKVIDHLEKIKV